MSSENPFMRGYLRGQAMKRQSEMDAADAEDRKFKMDMQKAQMRVQDLEFKQKEKDRANAERMQYYNLVKGTPAPTTLDRGSGITTPALQTQGAPVPSDFIGTMGAAPAPQVTTPLQHPEVQFEFGGKSVGLRPPTDVQEEAKAMKEYLLKAKLEQIKNTVTVRDPNTGQDVTGPKDLVDNLITQTGQNARQDQQNALTSDENRKRLEAESNRAQLDRASREQIAAANRQAAATRALQAGKQSKAVQQSLNLAGKFDSNDIVKNYAVIQDGLNFAKSLGNTSANDIGLLYAFAKAMDPNSVVREGEYATVQKYAQSWAEAFGFKIERIFSNSPFLSGEARRNMIQTIEAKASAAKISYDNFHTETSKQIRNLGENPEEWIKNYDLKKAAPAAGGTAAPASGGWKIIGVK